MSTFVNAPPGPPAGPPSMGEFRPFPPSFRKLQLVRAWPFTVGSVIIWVVIGVAAGALSVAVIGVVIALLGIAMTLVGVVWWSGESARRRSWFVGPDTVELRLGVWWRSHVVLPRSRVQNVTVQTGPLRNALGLVTVVVHSAGAATPNILLHGVSPAEGEWVHEVLLAARPAPGIM